VALTALRPHETEGSALLLSNHTTGLGALLRAGLRTIDPGIQRVLQRKAVVYAHCPQGHVMEPGTGSWQDAWGLGSSSSSTCGMCSKSVGDSEPKSECAPCGFVLCGPCDRKGLFRGYYSLGSVDEAMARLMIQEPSWIRYKARRYMAAAGLTSGVLNLDVWQSRLAKRLFRDLGQDTPNKVELIELFRRHSNSSTGDGSWSLGLEEDQFAALLSELLAVQACMFHL